MTKVWPKNGKYVMFASDKDSKSLFADRIEFANTIIESKRKRLKLLKAGYKVSKIAYNKKPK
jgi:hypothetical protein